MNYKGNKIMVQEIIMSNIFYEKNNEPKTRRQMKE